MVPAGRAPPGQRSAAVGLALILALAVGLGPPRPALAHAVALRSDPPDLCSISPSRAIPRADPRCATGLVLDAPPAAVRIWFSEPVEPFGVGIVVIGPSGRRVERGPVQAEGAELRVTVAATEVGTYQVRWQVVSSDTHPARGGFAFSVGQPSLVAPALGPPGETGEIGAVAPIGLVFQVAAHWLHFWSFALAFGGLAFQRLVLGRLAGEPPLRAVRRLRWLVTAGIAGLLLAEPLALLGQTGSLGPDALLDPAIVSAAFDSSFGRALGERLAVPILFWVLLGVASVGSAWAVPLGLALGAALAVADGASAHGLSVQPGILGLLLTGLHVEAMGVWVGGLVALVLGWPLLGESSATGGWSRLSSEGRGEVVHRFGQLALGALTILVTSGALLAALHLTRPADLLATPYGEVLAVKTALAALVVTVAVVGARRPSQRQLRSIWTIEVVGVLGILLLAGLLVALPPPR